MNYIVQIPVDGIFHCFPLHLSGGFQRIDCDGVVILEIRKVHNHRYVLRGFFYRQKIILSERVFSTKKELCGAIQKLLQDYL